MMSSMDFGAREELLCIQSSIISEALLHLTFINFHLDSRCQGSPVPVHNFYSRLESPPNEKTRRS